jgi:hypothetical protein
VGEKGEIGLAFFRETHYIVCVRPELVRGAIIVPAPGLAARDIPDDQVPPDCEKLTREALFERFPAWKEEHDQLETQLRERPGASLGSTGVFLRHSPPSE